MSSKSWYFLGFASLFAWIYFLSQPTVNERVSGFVLLLDPSRWNSDNSLVQTAVTQVFLITAILLALSVFSLEGVKTREGSGLVPFPMWGLHNFYWSQGMSKSNL